MILFYKIIIVLSIVFQSKIIFPSKKQVYNDTRIKVCNRTEIPMKPFVRKEEFAVGNEKAGR